MSKKLYEEMMEEDWRQDEIFLEEYKMEQMAEIEGLIQNNGEFNIYTGKFNNKIKNKKRKFAERNIYHPKLPF